MLNAPLQGNLLTLWIQWYFFDIPKFIISGWKNFLFFGLNYFSIPLLLRTFFSHWKRYSWSYGRGFDIGRYFNVLVSNLISRILGAIVRTILILVGIVFEILIFFFGLIILIGWFFLPVLLILGALAGFAILFS